MSSMLRVFVAIPTTQATRESLQKMQHALDVKGLRVKWVKPEQFHITLKFLGEIDRGSLPRLVEATRQAVSRRDSFVLGFQGVEAFPNWTRPRVLWSRIVSGNDPLHKMAADVEAALERAGIPRSDRPFKAHLTLGRVQGLDSGVDLHVLEERARPLAAGPEEVRRVVVYQSRLTPHGPIYTELASVTLDMRGADASDESE